MANENALTAYLAEILRKAGIKTGVEHPFKYDKGKRRLVDLVCFDVQGYTIGIEAKRGWGIKLGANKQASVRQADELIFNKAGKRFCDGALALIYPDQLENQDHLEHGKVRVSVRTPLRIRSKQKSPKWKKWKDYDVKDLPALIRSLPSELGQPEDLAKDAEIAVHEAFQKLSENADSIMHKLGEAAAETDFQGLLIDLLTVFMFHTKLDDIIHLIPQFRKKAARPPTLQECIDSENIIASLKDAYAKWLDVDYKDILEWNCAILKALTVSHRSNDAVKRLAQTAHDIQSAKGAHHHDLVGISFCNSIAAAKQEGAMYTTLPAATMLTHLMFHKANIKWKNLHQVKKLRIVDFACGSGTLLIACANYVLQKTKQNPEVAKALFEQMLYGFDINNRAVFQTAAGLGMIAPGVKFENTQLRSMMLGVPEGETEARLGSLEMLRGMDDLVFNPPIIAKKPDSPEQEVECDKFDFAIMNPPFTAREKRHKQKDKQTEKRLREREKKIRRDLNLSGTHNTNGFIELVHKYIDPKTGKAGIVLPASTATLLPAKETRKWLPKHFHIPYIIVTYDAARIFFSGNTDQGEMLLVLERKKKIPTATKVIKLADNPATEWDAVQCASQILDGEGQEWGEVDNISPANMASGDWSATQFLSNELYRIALEIPNHWTDTLGQQIKIKQMRGHSSDLQKCDSRELHATHCLWHQDTDYCDKMEVQPDCWVKPKEDKANKFESILQKVSRLKITERIRFTTIKNFACRTAKPSISCSWSTAQVADMDGVDKEMAEKAICIILNSTPAKVGMILTRVNRSPSYVQFPIHGLNRVAMPLLSGMKPSAFRGLAKVYDEWCKQPRKRLPEAHNCSVQKAIDQAVCKHTDFDENLCIKARHLLAQEPMVTGKQYHANSEPTNPELF